METKIINPCLDCGACCSYFRVSFHWIETLEKSIPDHFLENVNSCHLCMKGTNQSTPRCACLKGEIGEEVFCTIYQDRPSPCREFMASTDESPNEFCDKARAHFGLPPLKYITSL